MSDWKRWLKWGAIGLAVLFVAIQFVPYGRAHDNPPVLAEPQWDSPQTRAFAVRACFDCHSNETVWPWYTNIAPMSWLAQNHVDVGRDELNYSEWGVGSDEDDSAESYIDGEMPTWDYVLLHPEAKLSAVERDLFTQGLIATFGAGDDDDHDDDHDDDDD